MKIETPLADMRDHYDWDEAFAYAKGGGCQGTRPQITAKDGASDAPFGAADVAEIVGSVNGDNDGPDWVAVGRLNDGRWFVLTAGCDYTGWDCQAGGHATVAPTFEAIERELTADERDRLGVAVAAADGDLL